MGSWAPAMVVRSGAGAEEIVGVHGDEDGGVGIGLGDEFHGCAADGEVGFEVDLLEGRSTCRLGLGRTRRGCRRG